MVIRKVLFVLTLAVLSAMVLAGDDGKKPRLVASIQPLALMANDLGGEWLEVETLLGANQDPHHVALSVSQRRALAEADLVLWGGPGLESFLVKPLSRRERSSVVGFQQVLGRGEESDTDHGVHTSGHHGHSDEGDGGQGDIPKSQFAKSHDFHYWLHPELAATYYRALASTLAIRYPEKSGLIEIALEDSLERLQLWAEDLRQSGSMQRGSAVVEHQAYGHFADYFGVNIRGALLDESGVVVGPRTFARLAELDAVDCVVVEQLPPSRRALRLADALGVALVEIDPLGVSVDKSGSFIQLMETVAWGFQTCFSAPQQ